MDTPVLERAKSHFAKLIEAQLERIERKNAYALANPEMRAEIIKQAKNRR